MLRTIVDGDTNYSCLMFVCPGCKELGGTGLHMLPVNSLEKLPPGDKRPMWGWDGNLEAPTVNPSILTRGGPPEDQYVCHSYLKAGVFQFLGDCTHPLADQHVPIPDLPDWVIDEQKEEET